MMFDRLIISVLLIAGLFGLEYVLPHIKGRKRIIGHAVPNIILACINGAVTVFLLSRFTLASAELAESVSFGALRLFHMPFYAETVVGFAFFDLWMYAWHRANHRIFFLWRFHRMHHSDPQVDNSTALRFHPGEILLSSLARVAVIPVLGISVVQLLIYEVCLQPVILFHHSNVGLPEAWDRRFRSFMVTPNMHRVHHSREGTEFNSNYSSIFSFWDRVFRTFTRKGDTLGITYGLRTLSESRWLRLEGMLLTPLK